MKKILKYGLLMQIPNVIILSIFLIGRLIVSIQNFQFEISVPSISMWQIFSIIIFSIYFILNLLSVALMVIGITNWYLDLEEKNENKNKTIKKKV